MLLFNDKKVNVKLFPNGESYLDTKSLEIRTENNILKLKFEGDNDIIHLIFIKSYLDELKVPCILLLPYIPYSRMDRTEGKRLFTLKYFSKIINNLNFDKVIVHEPHSDVSIALLDRVEVINTTIEITKDLLEKYHNENVYLVYPDAGAEKRYSKMLNHKFLTAIKERDFSTGYITSLKINEKIPKEEFTAIIVDDLCSQGRTFILAAKQLRALGAKEIILVVTHCEDTIFRGDILYTDLISKVYTTNSILNKVDEKLIIKKVI